MPFKPPSWCSPLPEIPDSISIEQFMFDEVYGRHKLSTARSPFTCGLTGKGYSAMEMKHRVDHLARALSKEFGFAPNQGDEYDKVIAVFSMNAIDYQTTCWATHRIGGILSAANAAYNADELAYQLNNSDAKGLFTCLPLYKTAIEACKKANIPEEKVFILPLPEQVTQGLDAPGHKTVDDLIATGSKLEPLEPLKWSNGDGAKKTAFLCYSSGTSGLPKGVMISHRNVISNVLQLHTYEKPSRDYLAKRYKNTDYTENKLGLLPMSHIYGLIVICHLATYRGDGVIVLPKYELNMLLQTIQDHEIRMLYLVPPMIIHITKQPQVVKKYDLSSVHSIFTGAAPLGKETANDLLGMFPDWIVKQGYGLTETCTVVCATAYDDVWFGSSGPLLPGYVARIITPDGKDITEYNEPGELVVQSPSVVLGYLKNQKATDETFVELSDGRYMRTGDEAVISKSPKGYEHVFITDRIKELIKVKGMQVAPAELEAHLLTHPAVNDCVVIGVPSDREGEVPKAFVVKAPGSIEESDAILKRAIKKHVEQHKSKHKWLAGGVEFIDVVPKSPSGKILRRMLRDQEKEKRRKEGAKL
ncbi:phenylacetyl-CoA ligase-like protein [Polychaeton citri CBS 116435]|uniref:Phenylacetyl-CoA ligase-like protein n=1 Tax=Polychaeton citri CBS 116435 TaxID=1314669 RepID=A0A9P4QIB5_9PEZI|nr:phenylacetyl-CoA ligase-like protein [Polychaeton citri CBS 116435]